MQFTRKLAVIALGTLVSGAAFAQATVKDDGVWRAVLGLGASFASGNSDAKTINLFGDAVKATKQDKWRAYGTAVRNSANGATTADMLRLGTRYDYNLNPVIFGFGLGEYEQDDVAGLDRRFTLGAGLGYHVIKETNTTFDVFGGLAYTSDRFKATGSNNYTSLMLGEESTHKLSPTTTFTQRLVLLPNLKDSGEYRASFDAGLSVAMSSALSLNVGVAHRYNSDAPAGLKKGDTLITTGVSAKFE